MVQKKKNFDSKVTFKTNKVASRIFERQIRTPAPGTSVHCAWRFYENLVPRLTIYDVECPDHSFFKFTDDGQYLVSFSKNRRDLIVYRPKWLSYSCNVEDCDDTHELPPQAKKIESFFTQLYVRSRASSNELICKDFFLYMESNQFGIFATSTAPVQEARAADGAILGVPSFEKITIHLVRLQDGVKLGEKVFHNDCVNFIHNMGAFLYDDLLTVFIRPALLYGFECWATKKDHVRRIEASEMRMLRWTCGRILWDMTTNSAIRMSLGWCLFPRN